MQPKSTSLARLTKLRFLVRIYRSFSIYVYNEKRYIKNPFLEVSFADMFTSNSAMHELLSFKFYCMHDVKYYEQGYDVHAIYANTKESLQISETVHL